MAVLDGAIETPEVCESVPGLDMEWLSEALDKAKAKAEAMKQKAAAAMKKAGDAASSAADKAKQSVSKAARSAGSDKKAGVFEDLVCCKMPSLALRLGELNLNLDLGSKLGFDMEAYLNICGKSFSLNPMDAISSVSDFIQKNPAILSFDKDAMLGALMKSDLLTKCDAFGLKRILRDCILSRFTNEMSGIFGSDGSFGPSMKSRNYLRTKLNEDKCLAAIGSVPFISKFLSDNNLGMLLSTVVAMCNGEMESMYALTDSIFNILGLRDNAIAGLAKSIAYAADYNYFRAKDKLKVVNHYKKLGYITDKDAPNIYVPPNVIIEKLDKDTEKKNEELNSGNSGVPTPGGGGDSGGQNTFTPPSIPSKPSTGGSNNNSSGNNTLDQGAVNPDEAEDELDNIIEGLDNMCPGWQIHEAACSITIQELVNKTLLTRPANNLNLTGEIHGKLSTVHKLALVNKFNCCETCKPKSIIRTSGKVSCKCS